MVDATVRSPSDRAAKEVAAANFTGRVLQDVLATPDEWSRLNAVVVTFTPGARNVWHKHKGRQVLFVTLGVGVLQVEGKRPRILRPGDVAIVPPEMLHWHGATTGSLFAHLTMLDGGSDTTTWKEPVGEEEYRSAAHIRPAD